MAIAMVYRPNAAPAYDPFAYLGFRFEPIQFTATDGVRTNVSAKGETCPTIARPITQLSDQKNAVRLSSSQAGA